MAALLQVIKQWNYEQLESQLILCDQCRGAVKDSIIEFLISYGIDSVENITENTLLEYRSYLMNETEGTDHQKKYYFHVMQLCVVSYFSMLHPEFYEKITAYGFGELPDRNRVSAYLMVNGIFSFNDITADVRDGLFRYIEKTEVRWKDRTMKVLDLMKLEDTRQKNDGTWNKEIRLIRGNEKLYLPYLPDYSLALEFVKIQEKERLYFDFSKTAPVKMKHQFAVMLEDILRKELSPYDRRVKWIFPLKFFFEYCLEKQIEDVETISESALEEYRDMASDAMGSQGPFGRAIADKMMYFLFMTSKEINWDAHVWFSDRLAFKGERLNPACYPIAFSFYGLSEENRSYIKLFMRYILGISSIAVNRANDIFKCTKRFARFCESINKTVVKVTALDVERFLNFIEESEIKDKTFNTYLYDLWFFYKYLNSKELISVIPFDPALYRKKEYNGHNDRSIPEEIQAKMLANLKSLPIDKRLMLLIILCTGLRINEVCTLTGGAFFERDGETWVKVYQYKMKSEKIIPVPGKLCSMMENYVEKTGCGADEYVFKDAKGRAFRATQLGKYVKKWCRSIGIDEEVYLFRSHDARHSVATRMFDGKISLQAIRDYLGHNNDTMTRQYVDYVPRKVDKANVDYFSRTEQLLKGGVKNGKRKR